MNDQVKVFYKVNDKNDMARTGQICSNLFLLVENDSCVYLSMEIDCITHYDLYQNDSLKITLKIKIRVMVYRKNFGWGTGSIMVVVGKRMAM
jgi:hypothetical protein